jgi:hypothetical protein
MAPVPVAASVTLQSGTGKKVDILPLIFTLDRPTQPATLAIVATVQDQFGAPFVDTVDWSSTDNTIATVDAGGVVTPHAKGSCSIIAAAHTNAAISARANVDVSATREAFSR